MKRKSNKSWAGLSKMIFLLIGIILSIEVGVVRGGNNLDEVANELSAVARLMNGIAMQNDFTEHPENTKKVIAEFLNVSKSELLDELNGLDVDKIFKDLSTFQEAVKGIPNMKTTDLTGLNEGIKLLNGMRNNLDSLQPGAIPDPSSDMGGLANSQETAIFEVALNNSIFDAALQKLKIIRKESPSAHFMRATLLQLKPPFQSVLIVIKLCADFKTKLTEFVTIENVFQTLKPVIDFRSQSERFFNQTESFKTMAVDTASAKGDVNGLTALQTNQNAVQTVGEVENVYNKMTKILDETEKPALTAGFPRGSQEISLLINDFKSSRLLKELSGGKVWNRVEKQFDQLKKFAKEMTNIEESWNKLTDKQMLHAFKESGQVLKSSSNHIDKLPNIDQVDAALDKVENCVKKLTIPTKTQKFDTFDSFLQTVSKASKLVKKFKAELEKLVALDRFTETVQQLGSWNQIITATKATTSDTEVEKTYTEIRNAASSLNDSIAIIERVKTKIVPFRETDDIFNTAKMIYPDNTITEVLKSLDNTGIYETVSCLKDASYDAESVTGLLSLRTDVEEVKRKTSEIDSVIKGLTHLVKVKQDCGKIRKSTAQSRKRREAASGPFKLKNYQQIAHDVGSSVASLRSFSNIEKAAGDIQTVLDLDASIHSTAEQASLAWNAPTRDMLKTLPQKLQPLEKFAGEQKGKDLEKMWSVFGEASKITGPELDAKLLADPIAVRLKTDPATQGAAASFEKLSTLDLQFTQHKIALKPASVSLDSIRKYFDKYFETEKDEKPLYGGNENNQNGVDFIKIVIFGATLLSVIALLVGAFFIGRFIMKKRQDRKNWANREHYWSYQRLYDAEDNCIWSAIQNTNLTSAQVCISRGENLSRYWQDMTPLHFACTQDDKIVEALIKAGANREMRNAWGETPEQMARSGKAFSSNLTRIHNAHFVENMEKSVRIFEKYKNAIFQPIPPTMLRWHHFNLRIQCADADNVQDNYIQKELMEERIGSAATHVVLDVDANGVYNADSASKDKDPENIANLGQLLQGALIVPTAWSKLFMENPKNCKLDYEQRVMKVRYEGKVYDTLDEWRKWALNWAIAPGFFMTIYMCPKMREDYKEYACALEWMFSFSFDSHADTIENLKEYKDLKSYWPHDKKRVILIRPTTKEDQIIFDIEFPAEVQKECEVMTASKLSKWLLSMNGWHELEKKLAKTGLRNKKPC